MSKRIVIVEDRPWVMEKAVKDIKGAGIDIAAVLFYLNYEELNSESGKDTNKYEVEQFIKNTGIEPVKFTSRTMRETVNKYYEMDDVVILLDLVLRPDEYTYLKERMSVRYADEKRQDDPQKARKKIYFYTTSPEDTVDRLYEYFPEQVIDVLDFVNNQVELDIDQIKEVTGVE